jgi:hypothetical protein
MSSRERKRARRRKRKQRAPREQPAGVEPGSGNGGPPTIEDIAAEAEARGPSRRELKDEEARAGLEPLAEGERPLVVTVGAIVSALIAAITVGAWLVGAEVQVGGGEAERPSAFQVFAPAILFAVMAAGMWRARYWAVLGFQAILAIIMVGSFITLIASTTLAQALTAVAVLSVAGTLFWFMVKAMARIQMPTREGLH